MKQIKNIQGVIIAVLVIFAISACSESSGGSGSHDATSDATHDATGDATSDATGDATSDSTGDATSAVIPSGIKVTTVAGGTSTDASAADLLKLNFGDLLNLVVKAPGELLFSKTEAYAGSVKSFNVSQGTIVDLAFQGLQTGVTNPPAPGVQIFAFINDNYYLASTKGEYKIYSAPAATKAATWIAGGATYGKADGAGQSASFYSIGRTVQAGDLLYFTQIGGSQDYHLIRSIELKAPYTVKKIAGGILGYNDGPAATASFISPADIVLIDDAKKLLVVDYGNGLIRQIDLLATDSAGAKTYDVTTFAGLRNASYVPIKGALDATSATMASFLNPQSIAKAKSGNLYISEAGNRLIRKIEFKNGTYGAVSTIVGSGANLVKDNTPDSAEHYDGLSAGFTSPRRLEFDGDLLYFIDGGFTNAQIRKIEFLDGAP